jgi:amidase
VKRELAVAGEPIIPHVSALIARAETVSGSKDGVSVYDYWQLNKRKLRAQKAYMTKWDSIRSPAGKKVDILLTPVMPHSAVRHRQCKWVGYTKVWNVLDYSCIVLPGGKVRKDIDGLEDTKSYAPRNELDRWNNEIWDPEAMDGFPVGVQLVARRLEEEKVLGAAKVVEKAIQELRGSKDGI